MNASTVSLIDVASYLPGEPIPADYYAQFAESDDLRDNVMFRAPKYRHHVGPDESSIDMIERAAQGLIERHGHDVIEGADVLITHTQVPDMAFYGQGGGIAHRLGMRPSWVLDLNNGGCAAFVLALNVARTLLSSGQGRTALIAIAQNAAGQFFDQPTIRRKAQAAVPGDGAAVGLVTVGDSSPVLDVECRSYGEYAGEMTLSYDPPRKWWQAGPGEGSIGFTDSKITKVLARGNRQVPRWRWRCAIESGCPPRTSTCWSPTSRTGRSCATGATRWSCRRHGTSTPSTSAATCSAPGSRSISTARYPSSGSRPGTWS